MQEQRDFFSLYSHPILYSEEGASQSIESKTPLLKNSGQFLDWCLQKGKGEQTLTYRVTYVTQK